MLAQLLLMENLREVFLMHSCHAQHCRKFWHGCMTQSHFRKACNHGIIYLEADLDIFAGIQTRTRKALSNEWTTQTSHLDVSKHPFCHQMSHKSFQYCHTPHTPWTQTDRSVVGLLQSSAPFSGHLQQHLLALACPSRGTAFNSILGISVMPRATLSLGYAHEMMVIKCFFTVPIRTKFTIFKISK